MDEDPEDLDELPAILLDCSVAEMSISFEMPDARTIAAQRKLESEQDAEIKRYQAEHPLDVEDSTTSELSTRLAALKENIPEVTMPFENPGIDLKELNRMEVVDTFDGPKALFLSQFMNSLPDCDDKALKVVITWYIESIERCFVEGPDSFEVEDIHCNVVALALLILDKRCRCIADVAEVRDLMMGLLNRIGRRHQSQLLLNNLTEHLLRIVPHFHDRLALADSFNVANVAPHDLASSEYFSSRLAMSLTYGSLAQMLGYAHQRLSDEFTVTDLKDLVCNGSRWHVLCPYEQYYCLVFVINLLLRYADVGQSANPNDCDEAALNEMLQFLSGIKCNNKRKSGDFLKVKNLITKIKLLAQSKRGKDCGNAHKV